jgi:hypothetical protein
MLNDPFRLGHPLRVHPRTGGRRRRLAVLAGIRRRAFFGVDHCATEYPCSVFLVPGGTVPSKWSTRVCVPASISIWSVLSSAHVMCSRPGTRMLPAAP